MDTLKEFIELENERSAIESKIAPENARIRQITDEQQKFNDNLPYSVKNFIAEKLWDNFDSNHKERVQKYREDIDKMMNQPKTEYAWADTEGNYGSSYTICAIQGPFDPKYDSWWICGFEEKDDKIRIRVSCKKNEGTISGLMTFLDVHWTTWFDKKELENI